MAEMAMHEVYKLKSDRFVTRKIENELVIVPLANNVVDMTRVITLNETGSVILEALDGKTTLEEIFTKLFDNYHVAKEQLRTDILVFIEDALEKQLIEKVA